MNISQFVAGASGLVRGRSENGEWALVVVAIEHFERIINIDEYL